MLRSGNPLGLERVHDTDHRTIGPASEQSSQRNYRSLLLLPVAAGGVPLFILAVVAWLTWNSVWDAAGAEMERSARTAAEYGMRTLESYSLAAARVNDHLRNLSDEQITADERNLHESMQNLLGELSQSDLFYVIDRQGYPLLASNLYPVKRTVSLGDRDYFQTLNGPDRPALAVSKTFLGRFDGRLLFSVARPRWDTGNPVRPDGFDGVIAVSVGPQILSEGLMRLLPAPTDRIVLAKDDGNPISTTSDILDNGEPLPQLESDSPFYALAAQGVDSATYLAPDDEGGPVTLSAMQRIEGFPVYAISTRTRADIVARWWSIVFTQLGIGLPAAFALLFLSLQVVRDQRQLASANTVLKRFNDLSSNRLMRAQRFGLVGTFEYDLRTGDSRRSPEYMAIHGLPAVAAVETHDHWNNRVHPDDRARANAEVARVLSDESGATEYGQTYRIITPEGEVRWIAARGEVLRNTDGKAYMLLGAHVDVTPLRTTELALAESDARLRLTQEAVGIGAWEWRQASHTLICSPKMLEICGLPPHVPAVSLRKLMALVHPDDRHILRDMMRQLRSEQRGSFEFRIPKTGADGHTETCWYAARAHVSTPAHLDDPRVMGVIYDVTQRKRAEELTALMAHEVEHRAKNALTVVSSLLRMTKAGSAEELASMMDGRVRALSATMALLGKGKWQGADMREIVETELKPFMDAEKTGARRVTLSGPPIHVTVDAAQPLAMALHELVTNSAKYGALSVRQGGLKVEWWIENDRIYLCWKEQGGPALTGPPPKAGFGSRLMTILFEGQINGEIERHWEETGLVCKMSWPIRTGGNPVANAA